jgi:indolepyruvate ferredoxin oxidoreductase
MMTGFRVLAAVRRVRGTIFDPFSFSAERRMERDLLKAYEAELDMVAGTLEPSRIEAAAALLSVPQLIRGFGPVKAQGVDRARAERIRLLDRYAGAREVQMIARAAE